MPILEKKYSFERRQKGRLVENTVRQLTKVRWKYRNLIYLTVGIIAAYVIMKNVNFDAFISGLGGLGYVGAVASGFLYAFSLTAAPATAIFYKLGQMLNPLFVGVVGALGCVVGDYLIFRFVKNQLLEELALLSEEVGSKLSSTINGTISSTINGGIGNRFVFQKSIFYRIFPFSNLLLSNNFRVTMFRMSKSKAWRRIITLVASLIIMSPLPDEIGVALFGMIKSKTRYLILFSFLLNFTGIFLISYLGGIA